MSWTQVSYTYDGTFAGFLTCVYESYRHQEAPAAFSGPEDPQLSLYPERPVETDAKRAREVYVSLARRISPAARELVALGFLTCAEERELLLWNFIWYGYARGRAVTLDLTDPGWPHWSRRCAICAMKPTSSRVFSGFPRQAASWPQRSSPKTGCSPCSGPTSASAAPERIF